MKTNIRIFLLGALYALPAMAGGNHLNFPVSLEKEITDLQDDKIRYVPNLYGFDVREKDFKARSLLWLFLSAVREQYAPTAMNVLGIPEEFTRILPLHSAGHIFNENVRESFSIERWWKLHYTMIPNTSVSTDLEVQKIKSFDDLEHLRSQLLQTMVGDIASGNIRNGSPNELAKHLSEQIVNHIKDMPGNSQDARTSYIQALAVHPSQDSDVARAIEALSYDLRVAESLFPETHPSRTRSQALMFFYMLGHYFEPVLDSPYVMWSKLIPLYRWQGGQQFFAERVELRFYFSESKSFAREVFEEALPSELAASWSALRENMNKDDVIWAFQMLSLFFAKNERFFTPLAAQRIHQVYNRILKASLDTSLLPSDWSRRRPMKGVGHLRDFEKLFSVSQFEFTLASGQKMNASNIFKLRGLNFQNESDVYKHGIVAIDYDAPKMALSMHLRYDPENNCMATRARMGSFFSGLASVTQNQSYSGLEPGADPTERTNIMDAVILRLAHKFALITGIYVPTSEEGTRFFLDGTQ